MIGKLEENFVKWIIKVSNLNTKPIHTGQSNLEILIKAMFALNREGKWAIMIHPNEVIVYRQSFSGKDIIFLIKDHNNSELEALTKALQYIYEQENN